MGSYLQGAEDSIETRFDDATGLGIYRPLTVLSFAEQDKNPSAQQENCSKSAKLLSTLEN